ncbi:MAG: hypothetical protein QOE45_3010 [Frankiaceae bacterium]|nr:hypothetical protein [Frankiaceae bacterium]
MAAICESCGRTLRPGSRFCASCGSPVSAEAAAPEPTVVDPPTTPLATPPVAPPAAGPLLSPPRPPAAPPWPAGGAQWSAPPPPYGAARPPVQLPLVTSTLLVVGALAAAFGLPDLVYSFGDYVGGSGRKAVLALLLLVAVGLAAFGTSGAVGSYRRARIEEKAEDVVLAGLLAATGAFTCLLAAFELLATIGR